MLPWIINKCFPYSKKKKIDSENFIMKLEEACVHVKISMQEGKKYRFNYSLLFGMRILISKRYIYIYVYGNTLISFFFLVNISVKSMYNRLHGKSLLLFDWALTMNYSVITRSFITTPFPTGLATILVNSRLTVCSTTDATIAMFRSPRLHRIEVTNWMIVITSWGYWEEKLSLTMDEKIY